MVFVVIDLLRLSWGHILISPASLLPVIGACRLAEGVTVMPHIMVMMSSPLRLVFATLAGFARFHAMVLRAHAIVVFPSLMMGGLLSARADAETGTMHRLINTGAART